MRAAGTGIDGGAQDPSVQRASLVQFALSFFAPFLAGKRVRRRGDTVRGAVIDRRQRDRAAVDSPAKLRTRAPIGAGLFALVSLPAMVLGLDATSSPGGLDLPPAADARVQLYCIAALC